MQINNPLHTFNIRKENFSALEDKVQKKPTGGKQLNRHS